MEVTSHHLVAGARSENLPFCVTVMYSDTLAKCNTIIEEEAVERKNCHQHCMRWTVAITEKKIHFYAPSQR